MFISYYLSLEVFSVTSGKLQYEIQHTDPVVDAEYLSNGLLVTITWCEIQVFNNSARRIHTTTNVHDHYEGLACCNASKGQIVAVLGQHGIIQVNMQSKYLKIVLTLLF